MRNGRVIHWYMQRVTGAALLGLLVLHFWTNHYAADVRHGDLSFDVVQKRMSHPWMQAIEISFLLIALYHGLNGLRNIILDYSWVKPRIRRPITAILIILGIVWAYWGITAFVGNPQLKAKTATETRIAAAR
jgi:succinate dehydrogenase cytochrome b556 subunit